MKVYQRIIKECFWDMDITPAGIENILRGDDWRKKTFLFEKILANSSKLYVDLSIFPRDDLKKLLDEYIVPNYNREFLLKRKNIAEILFFDKPCVIKELQWIP